MKKKGNKSGRSGSRVTTVVSLSNSWDLKLARSPERLRLTGKNPLGVLLSGTVSGEYLGVATYGSGAPTTGVLGERPFILSTIFQRYKIIKLLFRIIPQAAVTGLVAVGVSDDPDGYAPVVAGAIGELRCSRVISISNPGDTNCEFEWAPIDKSQWYYCNPLPTPTNADERLQNVASLTGITTGTGNTAYLDIYYDILFEGISPAFGGGS